MTGTKDLFKVICSMDNLYRAYENAKKGKGWYKEVKRSKNARTITLLDYSICSRTIYIIPQSMRCFSW